MKAIYIKWLPATNTKPTRIKAHDGEGNSVILSRDCELNQEQEGARAALGLCDKSNWPKDLIGNGDVFVFAKEKRYRIIKETPLIN